MAETVQLTIPDSGEITTAAQAALIAAQEFAINTAEDYHTADRLRLSANERYEQGDKLLGPLKDDSNKLHKRAVALWTAATDPWKNIASIYRRKQIGWDEDQKAIQRRRQAEEDSKAKAAAEEEQRALAETMRELGLTQQAAEVEAETPIVQAPIVPRETESAIKYRTNWTFEIECWSCKQWVKHSLLNLHEGHDLLTGPIPRDYMIPDWTKIGKVVRALKGQTMIAGIRPIEEKV